MRDTSTLKGIWAELWSATSLNKSKLIQRIVFGISLCAGFPHFSSFAKPKAIKNYCIIQFNEMEMQGCPVHRHTYIDTQIDANQSRDDKNKVLIKNSPNSKHFLRIHFPDNLHSPTLENESMI
jgi:hypothetical protein